MNRAEEVKALSRENSVWRLNTSTANRIVALLDESDHPIVVLPMRDIWISGARFRGMKPAVCLSGEQLIAVSRPMFAAISETVRRDLIVGISDYSKRSFTLNLSDGREVKLRGMIGEKRVEQMTERLYSEISSGVPRI
jgi:hypothetical protein